jgi:hypothetical protein
VSKQAKTIVGGAIVAVAALAAIFLMGIVVGLGVAVVGGLAVVVVLQRTEDGPSGPRPSLPKLKKRDSSTTDLLHRATSTVEPLTTWTPPDALKPWTPPAEDAPAPPPPDADGAEADHDFWNRSDTISDFSDLAETETGEESSSWLSATSADAPSSWLDEPLTDSSTAWTEDSATDQTPPEPWADGSTWDDTSVATDTNPLDDIGALDEIDVIAELERLDDRPAPSTSMFSVPAPVTAEAVTPINEAVSSADDIMAASQATELQVESDDNSELAKLLAKVQARLAAYE